MRGRVCTAFDAWAYALVDRVDDRWWRSRLGPAEEGGDPLRDVGVVEDAAEAIGALAAREQGNVLSGVALRGFGRFEDSGRPSHPLSIAERAAQAAAGLVDAGRGADGFEFLGLPVGVAGPLGEFGRAGAGVADHPGHRVDRGLLLRERGPVGELLDAEV